MPPYFRHAGGVCVSREYLSRYKVTDVLILILSGSVEFFLDIKAKMTLAVDEPFNRNKQTKKYYYSPNIV